MNASAHRPDSLRKAKTVIALRFAVLLTTFVQGSPIGWSQGAENLVFNGSFEQWQPPSTLTGWDGNRELRIHWPDAYDGTNYVGLAGGSLWQEVTTNPGVTYYLTFEAATWGSPQTTFTVSLNLDARIFATGTYPVVVMPAHWEPFSAIFTADAPVTTIEFKTVGRESVLLDNVQISVVPEPDALVLLLAGAALFGRHLRKGKLAHNG